LDKWELANVKADKTAKQYLEDFGRSSIGFLPSRKHLNMWVICHECQPIVKDVAERLYSGIWKSIGQQFWIKKLGIPPMMEEYIDWTILANVARLLPDHKRQTLHQLERYYVGVGRVECHIVHYAKVKRKRMFIYGHVQMINYRIFFQKVWNTLNSNYNKAQNVIRIFCLARLLYCGWVRRKIQQKPTGWNHTNKYLYNKNNWEHGPAYGVSIIEGYGKHNRGIFQRY
jgi:hypothetical protein